jgi:hypothetical protein
MSALRASNSHFTTSRLSGIGEPSRAKSIWAANYAQSFAFIAIKYLALAAGRWRQKAKKKERRKRIGNAQAQTYSLLSLLLNTFCVHVLQAAPIILKLYNI